MKRKIISFILVLALSMSFVMNISASADEPFDISGAEVTTNYGTYDFRFKEVKPSVKVYVQKDGETVKLHINTDYTVSYSDNINAGTAKITVTGIGEYAGTAEGSFEIAPLNISDSDFTCKSLKKVYAGTEPEFSLSYKDTELVNGTDYTVNAANYEKAGYNRASVKFTGIGNFCGTKTAKATVYPHAVKNVKAKKTSSSEIKVSWKSLESEDVNGYKVYYVDKKGTITSTAAETKKNYVILKDVERGKVFRFKVKAYNKKNGKAVLSDLSEKATTYTKPTAVNLEYAVKSKGNKIKVGWKETTCSGYQIKLSTDKKFKSNVKIAYASGSKTSKKIKVKNNKKTFYVKVRAYTVYKGVKKFGKWSKKFSTDFSKLYEFYSTYYVNNPNRTTNLKLACKAIDGTIVNPGEVFSFNETVGIRTSAKGYKPAPIFTGRTGHEDGVGGGVCQVASTMFNAALYCNFTIVERHQHSQRVTYCPLGRDAAIFWGSEDFKFRNTSDYPIKISMECSGGKLTCRMYTNGDKGPAKVKLDVSRNGNHFTLRRYVNGSVNYTTSSNY